MKPYYRTSEFWFTLTVTILTSATAMGMVPNDNGSVAKVVSLILAVLASYGYTSNRVQQKVAIINAGSQNAA